MEELMQRRSDLAIEAVAQFIGEASGEIKGIVKQEETVDELIVTCIDVLKGYEKKIGKKAGRYLSIDTSQLGLDTADKLEQTRKVFSTELQKLLSYKKIKDDATCLIIGLGNEQITPDALGPMTVDNVIVTRHLYEMNLMEQDPDYREVSALVPGVMGLTGIETYDIIESVVKKVKPDFLVVVDALAARAVTRVNKMIQMTDTGISPGSGVGNRRRKIDEESLGIPVIAIGIPTVVDAVSVTHDTIDLLIKHLGRSLMSREDGRHDYSVLDDEKGEDVDLEVSDANVRKELLGKVGMLSKEEKRQLLAEVLTPAGHNLIVTPKSIDSEMEDLSRLISNALNVALHPRIAFSA
ncbi:MAG: GPR endopeptidase [Turicibacter sp.]|nr:GPR endopeptidase [Turicibacter sp.]